MNQKDDQATGSGGAAVRGAAGGKLLPRRRVQTLWGASAAGLSLIWLVLFTISLMHMPDAAAVEKAPEMIVTATYLPNGKSHLGLTKPDGALQRHTCDPSSRLCRFVMQHSPVELTVRLAGPDAGMEDQAVLFARSGDEVLVSLAEGEANLASLKSTYRGGLIASLVGLTLGGLALRRTRT